MITHKFNIKETPEEFYRKLDDRDTMISFRQIEFGPTHDIDFMLNQPRLKPPEKVVRAGVLLYVEYHLLMPTEPGKPDNEVLACVIEFHPRLDDSTTDVVAICMHPHFEPEFKAMFRLNGNEGNPLANRVQADKRGNRGPNEHDRIRTTLAEWAVREGKCRSQAHAATCLNIDSDTITNHRKKGWLYTHQEMQTWGDYEILWETYTTDLRKL